MKFYDTSRYLYMETDASDVSLGAGLLQLKDSINYEYDSVPDNATLHPTVFISKSLLISELHNSNTECEALGALHGLEMFHHYCFAREVCIITGHKLLVAILRKDVVTLSQWLQCIHQNSICIIYNTSPDLHTTDW